VADETDSHQIPGLPLLEIRSRPHRDQGGHGGHIPGGPGFEHQGAAALEAVGVVDHLEIALLDIVDRGHAGEIPVAQLIPDEAGCLHQNVVGDHHALVFRGLDGVAETLLQGCQIAFQLRQRSRLRLRRRTHPHLPWRA